MLFWGLPSRRTWVRVPPMTKKFFARFLGVVRLFLHFFNVSKGSLFFFSILQKNGCSKTPKVPPFTFFGTMRLTEDQKKSDFFSFFSSRGYCRREYLTKTWLKLLESKWKLVKVLCKVAIRPTPFNKWKLLNWLWRQSEESVNSLAQIWARRWKHHLFVFWKTVFKTLINVFPGFFFQFFVRDLFAQSQYC